MLLNGSYPSWRILSQVPDPMCGIGAIIAIPGCRITPDSIHQMMTVMKHRGPDDEGYLCHLEGTVPVSAGGDDSPSDIWTHTFVHTPRYRIQELNTPFHVMLGHRRLSIVDLSVAGHQPLCSDDQRYWIVYNGEIYNFRELREELRSVGFSFYSDSDTEVILKSYIAWGKECLHRFNGMWGFVIYDSLHQDFFVARDRFGVKPVYYWVSESGFLAISSEIKGFTALPGWNPVVNADRAYDFLVNGLMDHTNETLFSQVLQVRGGHFLEFSLKTIREAEPTRWYYPDSESRPVGGVTAVSRFHDLLKNAVGLRMRADVPVGSCLSGGLDSSSIVCLVHRIIRETGSTARQMTFSASSHESTMSEKQYSDRIIQDLDIAGHYVYPSSDSLLSTLDRLIWHQDEPFATTSIFAQWCVFQSAAQEGMKVMLDGQGADEILFGYIDFVYAIGSQLFKGGNIIRLLQEIMTASEKSHIPGIMILGRILYYSLPGSFRQWLACSRFTKKYTPEWVNPDVLTTIDLHKALSYIPVSSDPHALSLKIQFHTSLPMLLHFEDRNSMAHSIESRVPFTDYRIVEMALSLPSPMKWHQGISKVILRESMKGILPEIIRTRQDKMGFVTPEEIWITRDNPDMFRDMLGSAVCDSSGIVNRRIIDAFDQVVQKRKPFNHCFWRIIVFGRWMKLFHAQYEAR